MDNNFTVLKNIVLQTGKLILPFLDHGKVLSEKKYRDILHEADVASNTFLVEQLKKQFPDMPIVTEEAKESHALGKDGLRFVIDPLDGTINFSRGIQEFGVFLAFQRNCETLYGLGYKPKADILYEGIKEQGAFLNGQKLEVSSVSSLKQAVIAIDLARSQKSVPIYMNHLHQRARSIRSYGCSIHALGYIAEGKIDAYLYNTPTIWDIAAMEVIIREAGGLLLDYNGDTWHEGSPLLITTPYLKEEILEILNRSIE